MAEEMKELAEVIRTARATWTGGPDEDYDELIAGAALEHLGGRKSSSPAAAEHLDWVAGALQEVEELMKERGAKYGPGNIAQFGDYGVLVRLSDKLARLQHSIEHDFGDETAQDTWLDVIGYGLIGLAWSRKQWPGSDE